MLEDYITEKQYAEMRGVTILTIQRERHAGIGAPFTKLGRIVYYRRAAIDQWLLDQEVAR